jgi:ubiquitin-protein ligase
MNINNNYIDNTYYQKNNNKLNRDGTNKNLIEIRDSRFNNCNNQEENYYDRNNNNAKYSYKFKYEEILNDFMVFWSHNNGKYTINYFNQNTQNVLCWMLTINGPKGTLYEGGYFNFKLDFEREFNNLTEIITIQNQFYHLNFGDKNTNIYFDIEYKKNLTLFNNLEYLFDFLYNLFIKPKCELSNNYKKINEYINDRKTYNQKVRDSVLKIIQNN